MNIRRWFAFALPVHIGLLAAIIILLAGPDRLDFSTWNAFEESVRAASPALKLLIFAFYLSLSCTFLPLNTGWLVSAVAMEQVAVAPGLIQTVWWVSLIGAAATTVANLNDYHLFTLVLRSKKIARIRHTKVYAWCAKHFDNAPFVMLLVFNIFPIPIDAARMLAAGQRYSRIRFAVANFVGRFIRYAIIAGVTYEMGEKGWIAPIALLAIGLIMIVGKFIHHKMQRRNDSPTETR